MRLILSVSLSPLLLCLSVNLSTNFIRSASDNNKKYLHNNSLSDAETKQFNAISH